MKSANWCIQYAEEVLGKMQVSFPYDVWGGIEVPKKDAVYQIHFVGVVLKNNAEDDLIEIDIDFNNWTGGPAIMKNEIRTACEEFVKKVNEAIKTKK